MRVLYQATNGDDVSAYLRRCNVYNNLNKNCRWFSEQATQAHVLVELQSLHKPY